MMTIIFMHFPLTPARLWFLFSVAGFTKAEIADLAMWSNDTIDQKVAEWSLPWWNPIGSRGEIRDRIEAIRAEQGRVATLEAIESFLLAAAGPPIANAE
jgi:hypothetical protein